MPEIPNNRPLSPREAVFSLGHYTTQLVEAGACRNCALRMVSKRYSVSMEKALVCLLDYEVKHGAA